MTFINIISNTVASLVVSIGHHTLDNKIVLKASFPSAEDLLSIKEVERETEREPTPTANGELVKEL